MGPPHLHPIEKTKIKPKIKRYLALSTPEN